MLGSCTRRHGERWGITTEELSMHLRLVLPALLLGGALIAVPAAAGDRGPQQSGGQSSSSNPWVGHSGGGSSGHHGSTSNPWTHHDSSTSGQQSSATAAGVMPGHSDPHRDWHAADRRDWIRSRDHGGPWNPNWNHGTRHTVDRAAFRFSAHDYRHFNHWEQERWRHGTWHHGYHHGRLGWWWYLNGGWFFYNTPIYPYPLYLSDNAYYDDYYYDGGDGYDGDYGDRRDGDYDDYSGQPASDGYWYYCRDPQGYYPDVRTCRTDWQRVSPRDHDQGRGGYDNDRDNGRYDNRPGDDRNYDNDGPDGPDGDDNGPDNDGDNGPPDNGPPDNGPPGPHN